MFANTFVLAEVITAKSVQIFHFLVNHAVLPRNSRKNLVPNLQKTQKNIFQNAT